MDKKVNKERYNVVKYLFESIYLFFDKYKMKNANNYFGVLVKKINIIKRF
jgi:hypothetical protein